MDRFRPLLATFLLLPLVSLADPRPLTAMDNGLGDIKAIDDRIALVHELGYDGFAGRPTSHDAEYLAALDKHGVRFTSTYIVLRFKDDSYQVTAPIKKHIRDLKGRDTVIWLGLLGKRNEVDEQAALTAIRQVADLAAESGLRVALYPHVGFYTDTVGNCLTLVKKVDRKDVGTSFNLCHFLFQNEEKTLEATIRKAAPHLMTVQISGAKSGPPGKVRMPDLIEPLDEGDFDLSRVVRALDAVDYSGDVFVQCYSIKQPAKDHLTKSIEAWKRLESAE